MKQWTTNSGYHVFQVLKGRSNSYLIITGKENILIDTGKKSAYDRLVRNIDSLLNGQKLDCLILTHTHFDHCQNTKTIEQRYGCDIIVSKEEAEYAKMGYTPLPKGIFLIPNLLSKLGNLLGKSRFGYTPFSPMVLEEKHDDTKSYFISVIRILHTGGHSKGSLSIIIDNEIAIVGDTLFGVFKGSVLPPFVDDPKELMHGWDKLLRTDCKLFLPGHGGEIRRELVEREYDRLRSKYC